MPLLLLHIHLFYTVIKHLLLTIAPSIFCCSLHAQQEEWDTYMSKIGAKPASILVDMGAYAAAPMKLYSYVVITGPRAKKCDGNGLPSAGEIDSLERVLGATSGMLSGATAKKLVGTLTYNCERVNYYYVQDTTAVRRALNRMYENYLTDYTYSLKIKYDPQWEVYRNFLYPDSSVKFWMATNRIVNKLITYDGDFTQARKLTYTFMFQSASNCSAFVDSVRAHNYVAGTMRLKKDVANVYEINVSRYNSLRMDSIHANLAELRLLSEPLNGYFNMLDSEVVPPRHK